MKRIKPILRINYMLILIMLLWMSCCLPVEAEETGTFLISGLDAEDKVGVYSIATLTEWNQSVKEWLDEPDGNYQGMLPEDLPMLIETTAKDFYGKLFMSMIDQQNGNIKLEKTLLQGQESYTLSANEGYYLILPEGNTRIYQLKMGVLEAEKETEIIFTDSDFSLPSVEKNIHNKSTDEAGTDIWMTDGDRLEITMEIALPEYPVFYTSGKRVGNICEILDSGYAFQDAFQVQSRVPLTLGKEYTFQKKENVIVYYEAANGRPLFFMDSTSWFFTMDGGVISAKDSDHALAEYNEENNLALTFNDLRSEEGLTLLLFSFNTSEEDFSNIKIAYGVNTTNHLTSDGKSASQTIFSYTVSPIEPDRRAQGREVVYGNSYGIKIILCDGDTANQDGSPSVPEGVRYLQGGVFKIYYLRDTILTASEDFLQYKNNTEAENYYIFYSDDGEEADIYQELESVTTDEKGICGLGGLGINKYLVLGSLFPEGYSLSRVALIIEEGDWTDEAVMEGDYICDTLWMDYKGVFLAQTGGNGVRGYHYIGVLLMGLSACGLFLINKIKIAK